MKSQTITLIILQLVLIFIGACRPDELKIYDYYIGSLLGAVLSFSNMAIYKIQNRAGK
jgi:hypothetical protein